MQNNFETDDERPEYETFVTVTVRGGQEIKIPARWLQINSEQQIIAIALDPQEVEDFKCPREGYEAQSMGLLSEQGFFFSAHITNSLILQGWDFDRCADPALILITPEGDENYWHV